MTNKEYEYKIQLAKDNLNIVIDWIKHSDNKIPLINIFQAGLLTFLINKTTDIVKIIKTVTFGWPQFILYFSTILFFYFLVLSIYQAFKALYPEIRTSEYSMFYFASIAHQGKEKFHKDFESADYEYTLKQFDDQIHKNSQIAFAKFENIRKSVGSLYISGIFWIIALVFISIIS